MSVDRVVNASAFLQDYTVMYELISMNNGRYIIWRMTFPRVDDTFVTADKLLDLWIWKELYNVLTRITVEYKDSTSLAKQLIGNNRYELSFSKIQMSIDCIRNLFDVDLNLIREVLCVKLKLNIEYNCDLIDKLANKPSDIVGSSKITDVSIKAKELERKRKSSSLEELPPVDNSIIQPKKGCVLFKTHFMNDVYSDSSTESSTESSSSSESISLNTAIKRKLTPASQSLLSALSISTSDFSSDESSSSIESSASKIIKKSQESNIEKLDIPKNLQELRVLMNDHRYLEKFGFERSASLNQFRLFDDIYTVDGDISFAAFCSTMTVQHIQGSRDCKLFFYFSQELLEQFNSFSEVKFAGVNHILMVLVNVEYEELTPIGCFLLPNRKETLRNVPRLINGWLSGKGSHTRVTKCITPYDESLQNSIAEVWPNTTIVGCSTEYQKEIKLFAKENKGLGAAHKTKLTRLACSLCFLEEKYFSVGINVIKAHSSSDYGTLLVKHLRTKWLDRLKTVNGESIIYRSLDLCERFSKKVERDYFTTQGDFKHVWDFFNFLKSLTVEYAFYLERFIAGAMPDNKRFRCNTTLQKEKENRIESAMNEFNQNMKMCELIRSFVTCIKNSFRKVLI